jgi:hypothetical protein
VTATTRYKDIFKGGGHRVTVSVGTYLMSWESTEAPTLVPAEVLAASIPAACASAGGVPSAICRAVTAATVEATAFGDAPGDPFNRKALSSASDDKLIDDQILSPYRFVN